MAEQPQVFVKLFVNNANESLGAVGFFIGHHRTFHDISQQIGVLLNQGHDFAPAQALHMELRPVFRMVEHLLDAGNYPHLIQVVAYRLFV